MNRSAVVGVIVPAAVGGALFAPVFTGRALATPIAIVVAAVVLGDEAARRRPRLAPWRPVLAVGAGVVGLTETLLRPTLAAGVLPTGSTVRAFTESALRGWRRTLETSWPAPSTGALMLFAPLLVLLAATAGVEVLARTGRPLGALAPGFAVVLVSQLFAAAHGLTALVAGLACAAGAVVVLTDGRARRVRAAGPLVLALAAGALVAGSVDPAGRAPYALERAAPAGAPVVVANPLDEIGARLRHPATVVFTDRTSLPVDRWLLAVFDRFDGANWTTGDPRLLSLGATLPADPAVRVPQHDGTALVRLVGLPSAWLPTQTRTVGVTGAAPLVDAASGVLLAAGRVRDYTLRWTSPRVTAGELGAASLAEGGPSDLGEVPAGLATIARRATGGIAPSFRAALLLEAYLRTHYRLAVGTDLPTGHGYPQLEYFLTSSKRGTSEQFAAAYVVLARQLGIPARLAVGFRQPDRPGPDGTYVVRNADAFAWPEVAVAGVGWVPLDPTGTAHSATGGRNTGVLAAATAKAREDVTPPQPAARRAAVSAAYSAPAGDSAAWWAPLAWVVALLVAVTVAVPVAKAVRAGRRRRRTPTATRVVGAWHEARDRLRDHGIVALRAMTVRDLAAESGVPGLARLAGCVDRALWSDELVFDDVADDAWAAVDELRRGLRTRPRRVRLRAALDPRSLRAPTAASTARRPELIGAS